MAAGNQQRQRRRENRQDRRLNQRATRDVQLQSQPAFDYNNAQLQQAQENYLRAQQSAQSASGGAFDAIGAARNPGFDRIADQFTQNLNSLAPEFGGAGAQVPYTANSIYGERGGSIGMPENEVVAGNALGGAIGAAGLAGLANDDSRWGMLREGAQREASTFGRNSEAALRQQMLDTIQGHENEQQNLMAQQPYQIKQRMDELKDQAIEEQLARSKMQSDRAFSQALQDQLGLMIGGNGPGGSTRPRNGTRPGGNPGGAHNFPGQGTVSHAAIDNQGMGSNWGGASTMFPTRRSVVNNVRNAGYLGEVPGWVRYAFNHGGADALQNPDRAALYENKLAELLKRFGASQVTVPGPLLGTGLGG